jgi:hypothetical protein
MQLVCVEPGSAKDLCLSELPAAYRGSIVTAVSIDKALLMHFG